MRHYDEALCSQPSDLKQPTEQQELAAKLAELQSENKKQETLLRDLQQERLAALGHFQPRIDAELRNKDPDIAQTLAWNYPKLGRQLLLDAGWCVGELSGMCARCPPSVLLFLSRIESRRKDMDHLNCSSSSGCLVNQLDVKTYVLSHVQECSDPACSFIAVPIPTVCQVLQEGGIPSVR
jgi:hypothetical protein